MFANRLFHRRRLLILPPIAIGIVILLWMTVGKQPPARVENTELARMVRVVEAPVIELIPMAEGYGPVRPARVWTAVAQVAGRVIEIHAKLRNGEILPEGTLLVRIDPTDYELALIQAQAQLAELDVQEENSRASLTIDERNLKLANQDIERKKTLLKKNTVSQSAIDDAERVMLGIRSTVQNLRNTLALIPTQRRVLEAKVASALQDIDRTEIRAPFTLRVAGLAVEADQYVGVGQSLFEGDDIARVEIEAQLALSNLRRLFIGSTELKLDMARLGEQIAETIGIDPLVRLDLGNHIAEWNGDFVRFSDTVDPETRTMGVVVAVTVHSRRSHPVTVLHCPRGCLYRSCYAASASRRMSSSPEVPCETRRSTWLTRMIVFSRSQLRCCSTRVPTVSSKKGWSRASGFWYPTRFPP